LVKELEISLVQVYVVVLAEEWVVEVEGEQVD